MIFRCAFLFATICLAMHSADLAVGGGAGPASGNSLSTPNGVAARPEIGGTLLLNAGFPFLHYRGATFAIEVPVAVHGSRSMDVFASGSYAGFYAERLQAVLSPGVRVGFVDERRLSPWLSFGTGLAVIQRTGVDYQYSQRAASQSDTSLSLALVPAAGMDIRVTRRWFVRGELRNYLYRTPAVGFVSSFPYWNRWNYNPVIGGSLGFRF